GLRYQPGDALGVWYENDAALVSELLELVWLKGDEPVEVQGIALFPHLITGPLVRYSEIKQQLNVKHRRLVKSDLFWGMVI
ncbi:hypothetical protein HZD82_26140, partial [Pantoea agglomerans]|nr:hypothetical protein [Pantoea agglomerans]